MRRRIRAALLAVAVVTCISIVTLGCGKKDEVKAESPEVQQQRKDKQGD